MVGFQLTLRNNFCDFLLVYHEATVTKEVICINYPLIMSIKWELDVCSLKTVLTCFAVHLFSNTFKTDLIGPCQLKGCLSSFLEQIYIFQLFYAPEGTSGGILKSHHPSICPSVTNRVSALAHKLLKQI